MRFSHEQPRVDNWYLDLESKERFEIVALDKKERLIEVQFYTGEVEEMTYDEWFSRKVIAIAPPRDWSAPYEIEKDEIDSDVRQHPANWSKPTF